MNGPQNEQRIFFFQKDNSAFLKSSLLNYNFPRQREIPTEVIVKDLRTDISIKSTIWVSGIQKLLCKTFPDVT